MNICGGTCKDGEVEELHMYLPKNANKPPKSEAKKPLINIDIDAVASAEKIEPLD